MQKLFLILFLLLTLISYAKEEEEDPHAHCKEAAKAASPAEAPDATVGVDEHLGETIPLDLTFTDEDGSNVVLKDLLNKPTLLLLVFYTCPGTCSIMMASVGQGLKNMNLTPGKDYQVLTISFDTDDTPQRAVKKKKNYLPLAGKDFPAVHWKYLTGKQEDINKITQAVGFRYKKEGMNNFTHPNILVALSTTGKIIRYLYGPDFLPFDMAMALTEASKGTPGATIRKLVTLCFNYDPANKKYVFSFFRVTATITLICLATFFFVVTRKRRERKI